MKKVILISLVTSCFASTNAAYDQYGHWRLVNNTDENGNTFLHHLALDCQNLTEEEFFSKFHEFRDKHQGSIPNPNIKNKNNLTPYRIAFTAPSPICKQIARFLEFMDYGYWQGINDGKQPILSDEDAERCRKHEEESFAKRNSKSTTSN